MNSERNITFSAMVVVAGLIALFLFAAAFFASTMGLVLMAILVFVVLMSVYILCTNLLRCQRRINEQRELEQQAFYDRLMENVQDEIAGSEERITDTTMKVAKLLIKYFKQNL